MSAGGDRPGGPGSRPNPGPDPRPNPRPVPPADPRGVRFPQLNAYGDGGFRFDGQRVEGSVIVLGGAIAPFAPRSLAEVTPAHFAPLLEAQPKLDFVLFGVGARIAPPPEEVRAAFQEAAIGLEFMDTGAAARVYARIIGEGRIIAAALIAVD